MGPKGELSLNDGPPGLTTTIPRKVNMATTQETKECNCGVGQHTPKPQRDYNNRIKKGPTQKNKKGGRNSVGKENNVVHGKKKDEVTSIDVEANDVGIKRKERIPVEDISADEENGKKQKLEGEVMALGKIIAKHLGSALAARQPGQEQ